MHYNKSAKIFPASSARGKKQKKIKMHRVQNILWKKEQKRNSDLYVDIFAIRNDEIFLNGTDDLVNLAFSMAESESEDAKQLAGWARESGKQYFRDGKYIEAMNRFNCTLAFAKKGTADMGFAYGNRSACFFEMKMFDECLRDIEMAKRSNYPRNQLNKLESRAAECRKFMNDRDFMSTLPKIREPMLSFNHHADFAGVADCLKLHENMEYGRHVITTRDLEIGQTILIEKPFVIIPKRSNARCLNCFKACMNFISCENCDSAPFCDTDCMEKSQHEYECNRPACLSRKETFDLVLKMFFKINETFSSVDDLMETADLLRNRQDPSGFADANRKAFGWIFQLAHNHAKQTKEHLRRLRSATSIAITTLNRNPILKRKFAALKHRRFLQHLLLHLFHVAEHSIDLFQYQQKDDTEMSMKSSLEEYATGMYPFACYFNHSCIPNVCIYSVDERLIGKVIRPIKRGEQVFRSYM